ncbi:4869_t:CDS:2 [Ambispora gerdemannii]|uniref:4869_t:CDS:1 n=1 Tax=Ambispora gerdemannii TaxID=144530 RepID=A0A9N8ZRB4_9GLOM|nr:4869_t:CDS:2 [Ambispora gerdemannii]
MSEDQHSASSTLSLSSDAAPKIGNPGPLGLSSFALTTFVLSLYIVGAREVTHHNIIVGLALFYGGIVQILAGMWEFKVGNTFGATAFSSYGGFWLSYATILIPGFNIASAYASKSELEQALGIYLLGWTIFTFLLFLTTFKSKGSIFVLFFFVTITFVLLTTSKFQENSDIEKAGGIMGIITALLAWYNAMAQLWTHENSYFTLPDFDMRRKSK